MLRRTFLATLPALAAAGGAVAQSRAANAVNIGFGIIRQIIVNNVAEIFHI